MDYPDKGELAGYMRRIRRTLHRHPELAYEEIRTAALIRQELDRLAVPYTAGLAGGTGIMAILGRQDASSAGVALRADMDALPIHEETNLSFASREPGRMHGCGHDGHVAMLLGAVALLKERSLPGRVIVLFQPAEESGNGAARMIEDGVLDGTAMIFAGHIDTHYPVGCFTVDKGLICSYTDPFTIVIQGRGGHAARPHEAVDSIVVASNLVMHMQTLVSRQIDPAHAAVVTVGRLHAGTVHNVIAEQAILDGTVRSTHPETRKRILNGLHRLIQGAADMCNARITLSFNDGLPAVINDPMASEIARQAAVEVVGAGGVISQGAPSLGGEDFAFYLERIPGALIRFGAARRDGGAGPAHSSRFDFDEDVLPLGAGWLATVAEKALATLNRGTAG